MRFIAPILPLCVAAHALLLTRRPPPRLHAARLHTYCFVTRFPSEVRLILSVHARSLRVGMGVNAITTETPGDVVSHNKNKNGRYIVFPHRPTLAREAGAAL